MEKINKPRSCLEKDKVAKGKDRNKIFIDRTIADGLFSELLLAISLTEVCST